MGYYRLMSDIVTVPFTAEELEAYKNWVESAKPPEMDREEFNKTVFLMGVQAVNDRATEQVNKLIKEHPEKFKEVEDALKAAEQPSES